MKDLVFFFKFITVHSDLEQSFPVFDFRPVFELSSEDCLKKAIRKFFITMEITSQNK